MSITFSSQIFDIQEIPEDYRHVATFPFRPGKAAGQPTTLRSRSEMVHSD
jgi:hypothetical protein